MKDGQLLHFFCGKGGSSKTLLSSAFALRAATKQKWLLVSWESRGSLSELLQVKLSQQPKKLEGRGEGGILYAAECDRLKLAEKWGGVWRASLEKYAQKAGMLSKEEVLKLIAPATESLKDVAGLFWLWELSNSQRFDGIVVDGPSVGASLRLLGALPRLRTYLALLRNEKASKTAKTVAKQPLPLGEWTELCEKLSAWMKDPERFAWHIAALAEPLAEAQTKVLLTEMKAQGIVPTELLVAQVEAKDEGPVIFARRGLQAPSIRKYGSWCPQVSLVKRRIQAPVGLEGLGEFIKGWEPEEETRVLAFAAHEGPPPLVKTPSMPDIAAPPLPPTRFLFFGGPGGGGKSTCAVAAAVALTEKEGPVLLLSTDAAHSLSDVLQNRLMDAESQVRGTKGLYARELDAQVWLNGLRKRLREKLSWAWGTDVAGGVDVGWAKELIKNLIELGPAELEDFALIQVLTDALVQERFKRIVVDLPDDLTAFRFLDAIGPIRAWLQGLRGAFSRHKAKGFAAFLEEVAFWEQRLERFEAALQNPMESRFILVGRAEASVVSAMQRSILFLKANKLPLERVILNRVLPKSTCALTEERRGQELEVAKQMEKKLGIPLTVAPALGRFPAGLRELKAFRTAWYALSIASRSKAA
ncbi:MAG: arsenic-transporting ATPase [Proteobacteria bacterium]|nr:arsenic-transporting ATPase [Cystobacterineae bacterium]MCL2258281.1 arsenic-transporting ATPase [Cystobacterineae bacterium]MCL2315374.1 arsenic-transporting ATPase [Pseudomonadota bacterium]